MSLESYCDYGPTLKCMDRRKLLWGFGEVFEHHPTAPTTENFPANLGSSELLGGTKADDGKLGACLSNLVRDVLMLSGSMLSLSMRAQVQYLALQKKTTQVYVYLYICSYDMAIALLNVQRHEIGPINSSIIKGGFMKPQPSPLFSEGKIAQPGHIGS